jgi:uncharacterized repeat protein (TIGR01451 family)
MALRKKSLSTIVLASTLFAAALAASPAAQAATLVVVNNDPAGVGFNDPTPATPVGGNTGTTVGEQRLIVFQAAADYWGVRLTSSVPIRIAAKFGPLSCTATGGTLGSAGAINAFRDFPGAPAANTWFLVALANAIAGTDLDPGFDDISATFNGNLGTPGCLETSGWYYGLDGNAPANRIDLLAVIQHEIEHGLGFASLVSLSTGAKALGFNDTYMRFLENHGATPPDYPSMTDAQRVAASVATGKLHWVGANVRAGSPVLTAGAEGDHVRMYAPNPAQPGSSVSHWDTVLTPDMLMEPFINPSLHHDLELPLLKDIGWTLSSAPSLVVSPFTGMSVSADVGGPFAPASFQYQISASSGSVAFTIAGIPTWLDASLTSGTATTTPVTVTFTVNASANSLAAGLYSSDVAFTNTTNGIGNTVRKASLLVGLETGCLTDTTQANFYAGVPTSCDLTGSPGNVRLVNAPTIDQQNTTVTTSGFGFNSTSWAGQTFTPAVTGPLTRVDLIDLFCSGCTGTTPNITVSIRATSGSPAVPAGADLATATINGFNSGSGGIFTANFASPPALTAGTTYAIILRAVANPSAGTYAYVCSCAGTGTVNSNPYANGQRVTSGNSGGTWAADVTVGGRDLGFVTYLDTGFRASGDFVSRLKDANPATGRTATWDTLTWNATVPASTSLQFQVAASNNVNGPFNFVGPDTTAATYFTTSGASLAQFNGNRYLKYKAYLGTSDSTVTPTLNDVSVCFTNTASAASADLSVTTTDSPDPVTAGNNLTYTITVNNAGPSNAANVSLSDTLPAGTTFFSLSATGGWSCTTPAVGAAGTVNCSVASLAVGSSTFTLTVAVASNLSSGTVLTNIATASSATSDPNPGNESGTATTTVTAAPIVATTTSLGSSVNPSVFGQSVTFTATVSSGGGTPTGGTVTFMDGATSLGTVALSGGTASVSTSSLSVAAHTITATYSGSAGFSGSSGSVAQSVNKASSTTVAAGSRSPTVFGEPVTFTATVAAIPPGAGTRTGTVTFMDGATSLGTVALSGGTASVTTSALTVAAHTITATYSGDANFNASSGSVAQTVNKGATTTTLTSSPNPSTPGQTVTLTATVAVTAPAQATPTGTVEFKDGTTTLGSGPLAAGKATFAAANLTPGNHLITAVYSGDNDLLTSTSPVLTQIVDLACADLFADATAISGANGAISGSSANATGESGEPDHAGVSAPLNSVWCKWAAPANGPVSFDTTGSLFDTALAAYTGTTVSTLTPVGANDNLSGANNRSRIRFTAAQGATYYIAIDGVGAASGRYLLNWAQDAANATTYAAVLPYARSTVTGMVTTAFATILNAGTATASQCSIAMPPGFPGTFSYQTTDAQNNLSGTPNTPADIPAGGGRMFMFATTPVVDLIEAEFAPVFACSNTPATVSVPGVNTFLLSASASPTPDLAAVNATLGNDGIVDIPGDTGTGFFVAAAINVGTAGTITATADDNGKALPLALTICETDLNSGACINPPAPMVSTTAAVAHNGTIYYTVFVKGSGNIAFDPANSRLFLRLRSADGITRGATNVAVRTGAGPANQAGDPVQ